MINNYFRKKIIILLLCLVIFLPSNCVKPKEGNKGNTLCIVEMFHAVWLNRGHFTQAYIELGDELDSNKVQFIQYYVESTADHPFPRLSCRESEDRMKYYMEDAGLPTIFFNGVLKIRGTPTGLKDDSFKARVDIVKEKMLENISIVNSYTSPIKISGSCLNIGSNTYQIDINVEALDNIEFNDLRLFIALTENNIPFVAINGTKIHPFVFREFIKPEEMKDKNGIEGIPITLSKTGDKHETSFSFDLNTELYKKELNIVAFVQDYTKKIILQGYGITLNNEINN